MAVASTPYRWSLEELLRYRTRVLHQPADRLTVPHAPIELAVHDLLAPD